MKDSSNAMTLVPGGGVAFSNIVQFTQATHNAGTTLVFTLGAPTTAGNTLILVLGYLLAASPASAVLAHDTLTFVTNNGDLLIGAYSFAKVGIVGGDTVCTVTVATSILCGTLIELRAVTAADGSFASGTPGTSGIVTTTQAVDIVIAGASWKPQTATIVSQTAGWQSLPDVSTSLGGGVDMRFVTSYLHTAASGAQSDTWTPSASLTDGGGVILAYKSSQ